MRRPAQPHVISWWQIAMLVVANKLSMLTTYAPIVTGAPATRDAWLSALLAAAAAFVLALVPYSLMRRFPGVTVFRISRQVLGQWAGRALNLLAAGLFLYLAAVAVRMFSEVFIVAMIPETPLLALNAMMGVLAAMAAAGGFEVIARAGELFAPVIVFSTLVLIAMVTPHMDLTRLLPLLEHGPAPMVAQALTPVAIFGEAAWTLLLAMPFLRQPRQGMTALVTGQALSAVMISLGAATLLAVLTPEVIDLEIMPTLKVTRMIFLAGFLTRVEWLLVAMWMGAMQVKIALLLYGAGAAAQEALGLLHYRQALIPLTVAAVVGAQYVFRNIADLMAYFQPARSLPAALPLEVGLPGLLLAVAWIRGLRGRPPAREGAHG